MRPGELTRGRTVYHIDTNRIAYEQPLTLTSGTVERCGAQYVYVRWESGSVTRERREEAENRLHANAEDAWKAAIDELTETYRRTRAMSTRAINALKYAYTARESARAAKEKS